MGKVKNILRELFLKTGAISCKYLIVFFLSSGTLFSQGSVVAWGTYMTSVPTNSLSSGVTKIYSNKYSFAALKSNGSVVTWGLDNSGGDSSSVVGLDSGVTEIFSSDRAFAALKSDGSVVTWGSNSYGGDSSSVSSDLDSGVTEIFSTNQAFAALKSDGSVVTWGGSSNYIANFGGDSSSVSSNLSSGVTEIFSSIAAFAALKSDGSVVTWGANSYGGDSSSSGGTDYSGAPTNSLSSGVTEINSTGYAFAALKSDGSVVTWGQDNYGGDSSSSGGTNYSGAPANSLNSGVTEIFSSSGAFAALKSDGSVVTWGYASSSINMGGDSSSVDLSSGVTEIFSTERAFAALKSNGSVVTWGQGNYGGDSSSASGLNSGVTKIFSTNWSFAALKSDGSVVTWGQGIWGGDSSSVVGLDSGVIDIFSTDRAFAALKSDGSVVTWGANSYGGDSSSVVGIDTGVSEIFSTTYAFAALKGWSRATLTINSNDSDNVITSGQVTLTATFSQNMIASPKISIAGVVTNVSMTQSTTAAVWTYYWQVPSNISSGTTLNVTATASRTNNIAYSGNASLTLTISPTFYLASNGVTVKCSGCSAGDTGYVGGLLYTAHDNTSIAAKSINDTDWDRVVTTLVTNMEGLFENETTFNQDIGSWDTSNVNSMYQMFYGATSFNQNISAWDTSNVTNFNGMFQSCAFNSCNDTNADDFNQDISSWDTSSATDMSKMFLNQQAFNQDLSGWECHL